MVYENYSIRLLHEHRLEIADLNKVSVVFMNRIIM